MARIDQANVTEGASRAEHAVEFGASLREMRISHQRELADVAADLRIRQVYLQAIEDGRFQDLPGPTYAIGFVRAYSDYLGLDVDEVVDRFKSLGVGAGKQATLVPPSPVAEGRLPTGSVLLVAVVLAAAAYGGWYYLSLDGRDTQADIAALPQQIAELVGMRGKPAADAPVEPQPDAAGAPSGEAAAPAEPAAPVPSTVVAEAPAERAEPPAEQTAPAAEAAVRSAPPAAGEGMPPDSQQDLQAATEATAAAAAPPPTPPAENAAPVVEVASAPPETADETLPPATAPETTGRASRPAEVAEPPAAPAAPPAPPEPPAETEATPEPPAEAAPARRVASAPADQPVPPAAEIPRTRPPAAPAAPQGTPAGTTAAGGTAGTRIMLRASANAWVEVGAEGEAPVYSRLMRSGETFQVPPHPGMKLSTGNAGGIEILVDGRALPPLGPRGAIRRDVALDVDTLLRSVRTTQ